MVKKLLDYRHIEYEEVSIDDPQIHQELYEMTRQFAVPVTLINNDVVIGYNPIKISQALL
jgi:glutaredoxin